MGVNALGVNAVDYTPYIERQSMSWSVYVMSF